MEEIHVINVGKCFDSMKTLDLESAVLQVQERQGRHIVLNLQDVRMIDSRGLGKLFLTYHHLHRNHVRVSLINLSPTVREMLEYVNLTQVLPIYESLEDVADTQTLGIHFYEQSTTQA